MKIAMAMADKIGGEKEVGYVNTHGTSTPVGDVQELGAVNRVFTEKGYQPFVGSTKSMSLGRSLQECVFNLGNHQMPSPYAINSQILSDQPAVPQVRARLGRCGRP